MEKSKRSILITAAAVVGLVAVLLLTNSCGMLPLNLFPGGGDPGLGTVSLSISDGSEFEPFLIEPPGNDMVSTVYDVTLTNIADAQITYTAQIVPPDTSCQIDDVLSGDYIVDVLASNTLTEDIGQGSSTVTVLLNQMSQCVVDILLIPGDNTFSVEYYLGPPSDMIYDPLLDTELYDGTAWIPTTAPIELGVEPDDSVLWLLLNDSLPAGWYILKSKLYEQGITTKLRWGIAEALFIRSSIGGIQSSTGVYNITPDLLDIPVDEGGSVITIVDNFITLVNVDIATYPDYFGVDVPGVLTATGPPDVTQWIWFVNGEVDATQTTDTGTFTFTQTGQKMISVVGLTADGRCGSDSISIPVALSLGSANYILPGIEPYYAAIDADVDFQVEVFDSSANPLADGVTIYVEIASFSHPDVLAHCSLSDTSVTVLDGEILFTVLNDGGITFTPASCDIRISTTSDFSSAVDVFNMYFQ